MKARIKSDLLELMMVPGLSGHEDLIRNEIRTKLIQLYIHLQC